MANPVTYKSILMKSSVMALLAGLVTVIVVEVLGARYTLYDPSVQGSEHEMVMGMAAVKAKFAAYGFWDYAVLLLPWYEFLVCAFFLALLLQGLWFRRSPG